MPRFLPPQPNLDHLKNEAKALLHSHRNKDCAVCPVFRRLGRFDDTNDEQILSAQVALTEAQFALALDYGFKSWQELRKVALAHQPLRLSKAGPESSALLLPDPPPGRANSNRYTSGLHMLLDYCDADCDYHTVAGDSGLAFILQADDRKTPYDAQTGMLDIGWWPLDPFGLLLRLGFIGQVYGHPLRVLPLHEDEYRANEAAHYHKYAHAAVVQSLEAGWPIIAVHDDICLVTGSDDGQPPLLGQLVCTDQAGVKRLSNYPWLVIVAGEPTEPLDRRAADKDALAFAINLHHDRVAGSMPGKSTGRRSFALWSSQLRDEQRCGPHYYHANVLYHMRLNRQSASPYLQKLAERHLNAAAALNVAASHFGRVLERVKQAVCTPDAIASTTGREALATLVDDIAGIECEAFQQLQTAMDLMK